jgi:hypothetical protein
MSDFIVNQLVNQEKSLSEYRTGIRSVIRGAWLGQYTLFQFTDAMRAVIERGLRQAWLEGAGQCGIAMDELTAPEVQAMLDMINGQMQYIITFGADIQDNSQANGGKLEPLFGRGEMWINRYNEARIRGGALACADQKREWIYGNTREHCRSCAGYVGKVYRYSVWQANGALPRTSALECRGFKCGCDLVPTTKRITPGRFPRGYLG